MERFYPLLLMGLALGIFAAGLGILFGLWAGRRNEARRKLEASNPPKDAPALPSPRYSTGLSQIRVNGTRMQISKAILTYDQIVELATDKAWDQKTIYSITYSRGVPPNVQGHVAPGFAIRVANNMIINAMVTGDA